MLAKIGCLVLLTQVICCSQEPSLYFGKTTPLHDTDELWINNSAEPEWIDPGKCSDATGSEVIWNLFSGLTQAHPKTLEPMPDLAKRWTVSSDQTVYTFYLRDSVWSDGTPLTAHDFVWSWKRVLHPKTAAKYASMLFVIKNAEAYNKDPSQDQVGITALDDHTLEVTLVGPIPYFLNLTNHYTFFPVPKHVLQKLESASRNSDLWTRPEYIVTNGPYVLKKWQFRQEALFEKNRLYWDSPNIKTPRIRLLMIESYTTSLNLYRTSDVDYNNRNTTIPAEFMAYMKQYLDYQNDPELAVYFYWLNVKKPPLDRPKVRQALSLAIDRQSLVDNVTRGGQIAYANLVPRGLAGYDGLKTALFELTRARQLLKEAGFPEGKNFPTTTLIYNTSEGHKIIAEAIQEMWKKNLGINVIIENQEWKVYLKNLQMKNFQISRMGWVGDYPDPYSFLELLSEHSGNNHSLWSNHRYDELLEQSHRSLDKQQRLNLLLEAEQMLVAAQPLIPLYIYAKSHTLKPYMRGYLSNFQDRHPWKYLWIDMERAKNPPTQFQEDEPPAMIPFAD